jgi:hypothetical protein
MGKKEEVKPRLILGRFNDLFEMIEDKHFISSLKSLIKEHEGTRVELIKKHNRLKRDWYDTILDSRMTVKEYVVLHILPVWNKSSNLNSRMREVVQFFGDRAVAGMLQKYKDEEEIAAPKKKVGKPRKKVSK